MTEGQYPWQDNDLEVADLIWCAVHMRHILAPPAPRQAPDEVDVDRFSGETSSEHSPVDDRSPPASVPPQPAEDLNQIYTPPTDSPPPSEPLVPAPDPQRASPVRVPDPFPLPQPFAMGKSLLPLGKRVFSAHATDIDIDKTVEQTAEANGIPLPAFRPPLRRWFDLHLLIDQSPTMDFWGDLASSIGTLFQWQGIFRDVRVWHFDSSQSDAIQLFSGTAGLEREIRSLIAPGQDRLFVVVTDTLGKAWQSGVAFQQLASLGERHHVSLAHVFPETLWPKTAMHDPILRALTASGPGCANSKLRETTRVRTKAALYRFPILNLSAAHLKTWANLVSGGSGSIQGVLIRQSLASDDDGQPDVCTEPAALDESPVSPQDFLEEVLNDMSAEARILTGVLAAVPLIPPVMRLAQQRFLPDSQHWHLAEIFFSGLMQRSILGQEGNAVSETWYEFLPEIRQLLLDKSPVQQTAQVHREISDFVEERYGSPRDFPALIPNEMGSIPDVELDKRHYFAEVRGAVLLTWGGEFANTGRQLIKQAEDRKLRLESSDGLVTPSIDTQDSFTLDDLEPTVLDYVYPEILWPSNVLPAQPTSPVVAVATVVLHSSLKPQNKLVKVCRLTVEKLPESFAGLEIEPFQIRIAKLEQRRSNWEIRYENATARRYIESLSNDIVLEMVAIPAGTFLMGSPKREVGHSQREEPQHRVTLSEFFMGRYPVTQSQWQFVASLPKINRKLKPKPSRFESDQRPVDQVSWYDAIEFCARLSQLTGRQYRLPSESEWEYACRAGTTTPFHYGEMITTDVANYNGQAYGQGLQGNRRGETTSVIEFEHANVFGLGDMHGNVREWCQDHWHETYDGAPTDGTAWLKGGDSRYRLLRGGSWYITPRNCRSASRDRSFPVFTGDGIGFRIVLAPR